MDIEIDGRERKALAQASKTGWVYVLDRESGEPLHPIRERPVPQNAIQHTSPTQPYPTTESIIPHTVTNEQFATIRKLAQGTKDTRALLLVHGKLFSPVVPGEMNVVAPGPQGGANWPPSSYNPETGLMYVCAQETAAGYSVGLTERPDDPGAAPYLGSIWTITGFTDNPGLLAAFDVGTGEIAWMKRWKDSCYSGSTTTGGGLVFAGRNNGELQAFDAESGERRWSFQTGAGANSTATVFEHDSKQYVAFYAGGNSLAASAHGDNLWLFSLDGEMGPVEPGGAGGGVQHAGEGEQEATALEGDADAGEQLFAENCSSCHGVTRRGRKRGTAAHRHRPRPRRAHRADREGRRRHAGLREPAHPAGDRRRDGVRGGAHGRRLTLGSRGHPGAIRPHLSSTKPKYPGFPSRRSRVRDPSSASQRYIPRHGEEAPGGRRHRGGRRALDFRRDDRAREVAGRVRPGRPARDRRCRARSRWRTAPAAGRTTGYTCNLTEVGFMPSSSFANFDTYENCAYYSDTIGAFNAEGGTVVRRRLRSAQAGPDRLPHRAGGRATRASRCACT